MNFAEILFLFALDGGPGTIKPEMERGLDCALAGALLMDLALHNRVDTDLTCIRADPEQASRDPLLLRVVDKTPTGDGLTEEVEYLVPADTFQPLRFFRLKVRLME